MKWLSIFKRKATRRAVPQGKHYDLKQIYDRLNAHYFEGKLNVGIKWSGNKHSKPKVRVRFGSYNQRTEVINIHRMLDQAHIPEYFISYIIYHEMLHHVHPPKRGKRRRQIHHLEFMQKEKQFQEYALAQEFIENLKVRKILYFPEH